MIILSREIDDRELGWLIREWPKPPKDRRDEFAALTSIDKDRSY